MKVKKKIKKVMSQLARADWSSRAAAPWTTPLKSVAMVIAEGEGEEEFMFYVP